MFKTKSQHPLHFAVRHHREDVVFLYLIEFNLELPGKLDEILFFSRYVDNKKSQGSGNKNDTVLHEDDHANELAEQYMEEVSLETEEKMATLRIRWGTICDHT